MARSLQAREMCIPATPGYVDSLSSGTLGAFSAVSGTLARRPYGSWITASASAPGFSCAVAGALGGSGGWGNSGTFSNAIQYNSGQSQTSALVYISKQTSNHPVYIGGFFDSSGRPTAAFSINAGNLCYAIYTGGFQSSTIIMAVPMDTWVYLSVAAAQPTSLSADFYYQRLGIDNSPVKISVSGIGGQFAWADRAVWGNIIATGGGGGVGDSEWFGRIAQMEWATLGALSDATRDADTTDPQTASPVWYYNSAAPANADGTSAAKGWNSPARLWAEFNNYCFLTRSGAALGGGDVLSQASDYVATAALPMLPFYRAGMHWIDNGFKTILALVSAGSDWSTTSTSEVYKTANRAAKSILHEVVSGNYRTSKFFNRNTTSVASMARGDQYDDGTYLYVRCWDGSSPITNGRVYYASLYGDGTVGQNNCSIGIGANVQWTNTGIIFGGGCVDGTTAALVSLAPGYTGGAFLIEGGGTWNGTPANVGTFNVGGTFLGGSAHTLEFTIGSASGVTQTSTGLLIGKTHDGSTIVNHSGSSASGTNLGVWTDCLIESCSFSTSTGVPVMEGNGLCHGQVDGWTSLTFTRTYMGGEFNQGDANTYPVNMTDSACNRYAVNGISTITRCWAHGKGAPQNGAAMGGFCAALGMTKIDTREDFMAGDLNIVGGGQISLAGTQTWTNCTINASKTTNGNASAASLYKVASGAVMQISGCAINSAGTSTSGMFPWGISGALGGGTSFGHNAYQLHSNGEVANVSGAAKSLAQWQGLGYDTTSVAGNLLLDTNDNNTAGGPTLGLAVNRVNAPDITGTVFANRNDAGCYESLFDTSPYTLNTAITAGILANAAYILKSAANGGIGPNTLIIGGNNYSNTGTLAPVAVSGKPNTNFLF